MELLWILFGLLLGGGIAAAVTFLVVDRRSQSTLGTARADLAIAAGRAVDARQTLAALTQAADADRQELAAARHDRATLAAQLAAGSDNLRRQTEASSAAVAAVEALRHEAATLQQERSALHARLDAERQAITQLKEQTEQSNARLREQFAATSSAQLKTNREEFFALAEQRFNTLQSAAAGAFDEKKAEMGQLIGPMRQTLDEYRTKLEAIEQSRQTAYVDIQKHLAGVATTQLLLSTKTEQLVSALRKPQGRGRWGELTLRRLFELAGLTDHVTFSEQVSTDDGRQRPDCIVRLPEGRQVIVDSKCVMDAFLDAAACVDDDSRQNCIARHAEQVRSRVRDLSSKAYWESFEQATDYVVLFLPGEAFLYAAVEQDPSLIEDAMNQRVIVASPTTLLGLLRVIEHGWRHKAVEDNALQIKEVGGRLYERVVKVSEHLQRLGRAVSQVTSSYNDTVGSLEKNVLSAARDMAKLGVPTKNAAVPVVEELADDTRSLRTSAWKGLPEPLAAGD